MSPKRRSSRPRGADLFRLDVFSHLFSAVAEEMGANLLRSSFSPNIRERRDFSCALFDGEGRMIGQASHLPVHLGSTPLSVRAAIEAFSFAPGDAVLLNDPLIIGNRAGQRQRQKAHLPVPNDIQRPSGSSAVDQGS